MSKVISIISEHLNEKRLLMIGFGILMGIFGYAITLIVDVIDLSEIEELLSSLPELQELLDLFGDLTSPYALLNVEVFAFFWIFVGFFFVYVVFGCRT